MRHRVVGLDRVESAFVFLGVGYGLSLRGELQKGDDARQAESAGMRSKRTVD